MSANVHNLLHLSECVRNLGPLWAHSCFPFENTNGDLLKLFHGSQGVEKQVQFLYQTPLSEQPDNLILRVQGHIDKERACNSHITCIDSEMLAVSTVSKHEWP